MRTPRITTRIVFVLACLTLMRQTSSQSPSRASSDKRIIIAASTILDGKGQILHNTRIVIEGSKIAAIDPKASPVDYDLRGLTVLPGWIGCSCTFHSAAQRPVR